MVANYHSDVRDDNFFAVVHNCFDHDKAVELIEAAYTEEELEVLKNSRSRRMRLDLSDSLECVFAAFTALPEPVKPRSQERWRRRSGVPHGKSSRARMMGVI